MKTNDNYSLKNHKDYLAISKNENNFLLYINKFFLIIMVVIGLPKNNQHDFLIPQSHIDIYFSLLDDP